LSAKGSFDQSKLLEEVGIDSTGADIGHLPARRVDEVHLDGTASYQIRLIGQTSVAPTLSFRREIRLDSLTEGRYVPSLTRIYFGAGLTTALFGRFPGIGPFSAIRHRINPGIAYAYTPAVAQSALQERVFGKV